LAQGRGSMARVGWEAGAGRMVGITVGMAAADGVTAGATADGITLGAIKAGAVMMVIAVDTQDVVTLVTAIVAANSTLAVSTETLSMAEADSMAQADSTATRFTAAVVDSTEAGFMVVVGSTAEVDSTVEDVAEC
jgi:hypothetical protein